MSFTIKGLFSVFVSIACCLLPAPKKQPLLVQETFAFAIYLRFSCSKPLLFLEQCSVASKAKGHKGTRAKGPAVFITI